MKEIKLNLWAMKVEHKQFMENIQLLKICDFYFQ